jgi:hypothetical protein
MLHKEHLDFARIKYTEIQRMWHQGEIDRTLRRQLNVDRFIISQGARRLNSLEVLSLLESNKEALDMMVKAEALRKSYRGGGPALKTWSSLWGIANAGMIFIPNMIKYYVTVNTVFIGELVFPVLLLELALNRKGLKLAENAVNLYNKSLKSSGNKISTK